MKALEIAQDINYNQAQMYLNFGCFYQTLAEECKDDKLMRKAYSSYRKAFREGLKQGNSDELLNSFGNLTIVSARFHDLTNISSDWRLFQSTIQKHPKPLYLYTCYLYKGMLAKEKQQYDEALFWFRKQADITDDKDRIYIRNRIMMFLNIGEVLFLLGTPVDLGLPSGTLWADRNVGADKAEEPGNYYGWGETVTHDTYSWENYTLWDYANDKWLSWDGDSLDFANSNADVAHVKWGDKWRTPSQAQFQELVDNCTWAIATQDGTKGYKVTGKNGNSIFLPFNGVKVDEEKYVGTLGNYWSSSRVENPQFKHLGYALFLAPDDEDGIDPKATAYRYYGYAVRPVVGNASQGNQIQAVDMALPSGTKWANMNIGASKPEEYGNYYAWAETKTKENYDTAHYAYYNAETNKFSTVGGTRECIYYDVGNVKNDTVNVYDIQNSDYDVASWKLGGDWMMPTNEQFGELMQYCTWTWTTQNGIPGYLITATNNNSIFLPAAGMKCKDYTSGPTKSFYYWTSNMPQGDDDGTACEFMGYKDYSSSIMTGSRYYGCPVRAVCK